MTLSNKKTNMMDCNRKHPKFALSALAAGIVLIASTSAHALQITDLSTSQEAGNTKLNLHFDGVPVEPQTYKLTNPNRLVLDFLNVENGLQRTNNINVGAIKSATAVNSRNSTRVILTLNQDGDYAASVSGQDLVVSVNGSSNSTAVDSTDIVPDASPVDASNGVYDGASSEVTKSALTAVSLPEPDYNPPSSYNNPPVVPKATVARSPEVVKVRVNPLLNPNSSRSHISSQYSYDGIRSITPSGNSVSIGLANEAVPLDINRQGNKIVIRTSGYTIPKNLLKRLTASGGLIDSIDSRNNGQSGLITINMNSDFEYQAYQSGRQVSISVTPPKLLSEPTLEEKVYEGEPLSLEFQDVEVRSVFDILAQFTEMNIVVGDNVSGNITLRLMNVPWDQALDIILKSKNLDKRVNGNVILIAPTEELIKQDEERLKAQQTVKTYSPLRTEYIRLSYAKAADILTLISQGKAAKQNNDLLDSGSLLSERGTVTVDTRTNTLIVKDTSSSIENIRALVSKIDVPVRQVMIEARIVSAKDNFSKQLGVKWGLLSNGAATNRNLLVGGSQKAITGLKEFDVETTTVNGKTIRYPSYDVTVEDNLNVDLGIGGAAGKVAFGLLNMSDMMIDLELSALQADGRGEVISTPKVLTSDKQKAKIASGTQIPYQEASASGATSTSFIEAALSLEVTPNITPDGKIGMELSINSDAPRQLGTGQYAIDTNSVNTNIVVEDGQTVVLGGVFRNTISRGATRVPFLGDLPMVGQLFRRKVQSDGKEELLIFVTPKLINDGFSRLN